MKKIFALFLLNVLFLSPFLSLADNATAIVYLQAQTQNPWISQSLAAAGINNLDISYIDAQEQDLMKVAKYLLALAALESQDNDTLATLFTTLTGHLSNGQFGSDTQLNDDFWGLLAAGAVGRADDFASVKDFIINHQNPDGGWSWAANGPSDSNDTAAAILALREFGLAADNVVITNALNYLQSTQNPDGGLAYDANADSDGASTAWVLAALNKLNISPSAWTQGENTPLSFLNSLQQSDGSFLWLPADAQGSSMVTAYALLALTGQTYPVNHVEIIDEDNGGNEAQASIRIEGPDNTICLADNLNATTILEVLVEAASVCDFTYQVQDTEYGPYVASIAGNSGQGLSGWQYWLNWQPGAQAANVQTVADGDEILWAYGPFDILPSRLSATLSGDDLQVQAEYYNGTVWQNLSNQSIMVGEQTLSTDANGHLSVNLANNGVYPVYVSQTDDYIRSPKVYITVGSGVSQSVALLVDIDNDGEENPPEQISFSVNQASLNFGQLEPGQIGENILQLQNTGNVAINLEANVLGSDVFTQYVSLENTAWQNWQEQLNPSNSESINVKLSLPNNLQSTGSQTGQLIFWAQAR
ncbi:DUF4430 domain-containing protein [Patescibacteria group bacterium]|nr:DUF4430 domain-containing protein [Patescibacteria group bacterium]